jgi:hypothetical protein
MRLRSPARSRPSRQLLEPHRLAVARLHPAARLHAVALRHPVASRHRARRGPVDPVDPEALALVVVVGRDEDQVGAPEPQRRHTRRHM